MGGLVRISGLADTWPSDQSDAEIGCKVLTETLFEMHEAHYLPSILETFTSASMTCDQKAASVTFVMIGEKVAGPLVVVHAQKR